MAWNHLDSRSRAGSQEVAVGCNLNHLFSCSLKPEGTAGSRLLPAIESPVQGFSLKDRCQLKLHLMW